MMRKPPNSIGPLYYAMDALQVMHGQASGVPSPPPPPPMVWSGRVGMVWSGRVGGGGLGSELLPLDGGVGGRPGVTRKP